MIKHSSLLLVAIVLVACANRAPVNTEGIVLGVIRTWMNIPDTYVIDTKGSGSIDAQLPGNLDGIPEWSPDGKWIISSSQYEVGRPEDSAIYLSRSDGSQRQVVIHNTGGSFDPSWSPDGTRITYYARDNQPGIYLLDMQCFESPEKKCNSSPIFLASGDSSPDWSPDGKKIVYEKKGNIFVINSDGGKQPLNLSSDMKYCYDPNWSPDGKRILFSCFQTDHHDIFVVKADGSELINLTRGVGSNTKPSWSPDGNKIAFISNRGGLGQIIGIDDTVRSNAIFVMDYDGNNVVRLSLRDDERVLWFTWLPRNFSVASP